LYSLYFFKQKQLVKDFINIWSHYLDTRIEKWWIFYPHKVCFPWCATELQNSFWWTTRHRKLEVDQ